MDSHFGDGRIYQHQCTESEQDDAADGEDTVAYKFGFEREQHKRSHDHGQGGKACGQQVKRERRQQNENYADGAR